MASALAGRRVVVTRAADQAEELCALLAARGATPVHFPVIDFAPLASPELAHALEQLGEYGWIVFTSANAARFFLAHTGAGRPLPRVAAVGSATARHLHGLGIQPDFTPDEFTGDRLAATLPDVTGARILLPRGRQGLPDAAAGLRSRGATVDEVVVYDTVRGQPGPTAFAELYRGIDAVTFASPSAARHFYELVDTARLGPALIACIGPTTAAAVAALGRPADLVADPHTGEGLVGTLEGYYQRATHVDLTQRPRRLRHTPGLRAMVRETALAPADFIYPLFVCHGHGVRHPIASMPGVAQLSVDQAVEEAAQAASLGVPAVLLFGIPAAKDPVGLENFDDDGIVQRAVRAIKQAAPELVVITDVCLCEYTDHGHCGLLHHRDGHSVDDHLAEGYVLNDETLAILGRVALSHARAGADVVAPSGMLDGMVAAIRSALDASGCAHVAIMSYAVKYASQFYGPFREAAAGAPKFGDRKTHQMDPANVREALREAALDVEQGADFLMVKPALAYLDVIHRVHAHYPYLPMVAYNVSGEYAMVKAAIANGWLGADAYLEILLGIKRAGADLIITYHALEAAQHLISKFEFRNSNFTSQE